MKTIIAKLFFNIDTFPKEALEIIKSLFEEISKLEAENEVLKKSETHKNAEVAPIEKNSNCFHAFIKQRDALLNELRKAENDLEKKDKEINSKIALIIKLEKHLDTKLTTIKGLEATVKTQSQVLDVLNKKIIGQHDKIVELVKGITKYRSALLDLEGTMCAQSDHSQELANTIHKILNED